MKVIVVITTHRRTQLLRRTLASITAAKLPREISGVFVLENDGKSCSNVVGEYSELPLQYRFFPEGNKSRALNWLLPELASAFVVFLDDDVQIPQRLLERYCKAFRIASKTEPLASRVEIAFWGGPVSPEFEESPPQWLLPKLPRSVNGWTLGTQSQVVDRPAFLGCNWAANANRLIEVGGFDEKRGPGANTVTMGQEASAQQRLIDAGYRGLYLPGEPVLHHVPKNRCSPEWALDRAERNGRGFGMRYANRYGRWIGWPARVRLACAKWRLKSEADLYDSSDFQRVYDVRRWKGFVEGVTNAS